MSSPQCADFTKAQDSAKSQLSGALKELSALKKDLQSGKLTSQDKAVSAALDKYLGGGAGHNMDAISSLTGSATRMLGVLNGNMLAQFAGGGSTAYAHADRGQLTLFSAFFASSPKQQIETVAHEASHHGAGTNDTYVTTGEGSKAIPAYGASNISTMAKTLNDPFYMLQKADAVTLSLGIDRDDNW